MKFEVELTINSEAIKFVESLRLEDFFMENEFPSKWSDDEFEFLVFCLLKRNRINLVLWQIITQQEADKITHGG